MEARDVVRAGATTLVWLGLASASVVADDQPWRVDSGDVRILVPLKPGGAFEAKTTSLRGELIPGSSRPLAVSGEIAVDLASIDTGISLRNRHLREKYLEVARGPGYDEAVLSDLVLAEADGTEFRGKTPFTARLLLHGVQRPVSGKSEIRPAAAGVRVDAEFLLILPDFGIEPPQYMGVGVTSRLVVRVSFDVRPAEGHGPQR